MARRVRTRLTAKPLRLAAGLTCLVVGVTIVATGFSSCRDDRDPSKPAAEVLESIRANCLGSYRDRFTKIAIDLRRERTDARATLVMIDTAAPAGGNMRVSDANGSNSLLVRGSAQSWTTTNSVRSMDSPATQRLVRLRDEVCAALLRPVVEAHDESAVWTDADTIEFQTRAGATWQLDVTQDGLPRAVRSHSATVEFVQLSRTAPQLPRVVRFTELGARHLRILGDRVDLKDSDFIPPSTTSRPAVDIELSRVDRPSEPVFRSDDRVDWLCVPDPGTWATRLQACFDLGPKLGAAGQKNGGDPLLFRDENGAWLAIPFVPDTRATGTGYRPDPGERVLPSDDETGDVVAVVLAPSGNSFDARIDAGRALLDAYLARHERKPGGPLRIVVNLVYEEDLTEGSPTELSMDVRLELPVQR